MYADENSCGMCTVEISDNCSETSGSIKSTNGDWNIIDEISGWDYSAVKAMACPGSFCTDHNLYGEIEVAYDQINGQYALTHSVSGRSTTDPEPSVPRAIRFFLGGGRCYCGGEGNGQARCDTPYSRSTGSAYGFSVLGCTGTPHSYIEHPACNGTGTLFGSYFRVDAVRILEWEC